MSLSKSNISLPKNISPFDLAYIGGFFDGEGHVMISHSTNGSASRNRIFRLQVGVAQKSPVILQWLKELFGGWIYKSQHTQCHQWNLASRQAGDFLQVICSHVKVKKDVVMLALEYRKLVDTYTRGRGNYMPTETSERMLQIRHEIMALNRT